MNEIIIKEVETLKQFDILLNEEVIGSAVKYPDMTLSNFLFTPNIKTKDTDRKH